MFLKKLVSKKVTSTFFFFVHLGPKEKLVVPIYVDDLIIKGNNGEVISHLKTTLQHHFPITDLGSLKYFYRIKMVVSHKRLFLNQRKYVLDLLRGAAIMNVKLASTLLDSKLKLETTSERLRSINYYQHLVSKLIYFTITRPNITYITNLVS